MPGQRTTDLQVNRYKELRRTLTQESAAAKTGISVRTARRIEHLAALPSQRPMRNWRTRSDPLAPVWDAEILPLLRRAPGLTAVTIFEELFAPLWFSAPRSGLEKIVPDPNAHIGRDDLTTFESWLSSRVRRRVLPNEFDRRLSAENHKRIRRSIGAVEQHVHVLLYSLSPQDELDDENEPYRLSFVILAKSASLRDRQVLEQMETAKDQIEELLDGRAGIISTVSIAGDESMTFAQFRTFADWGFEDLSLETGNYEQGDGG